MTLFYQYNCVLHLGPLMLERRSYNDERWRSWRRFKGDKLMNCKTRAQNNAHSTTEVRWLVLSARRARGKTVTHIQRENQAVLHHARRCCWVCLSGRRVCRCDSVATFTYSVWCPPPPPTPVTDSGTGWEPFETRGQRALLFTQSFFPDRDGCLNKFSTYAHHMDTLIYFFSTATLKCEPTPKPLYITFNLKKRCQSSRLTWLPGSSGRLIRSQRASESVTRRAAVYFTMRTCDPVTTQ